MPVKNERKSVHLVKRPLGLMRPEDFEIVTTEMPDLVEGQILVRNIIASVDPYMRGRFEANQPLNVPISGAGIGEVVSSAQGRPPVGTLVRHNEGLQDYFSIHPSQISRLRCDPAIPLPEYLHALGAPGLTAYGGVRNVLRVQAGEAVFVSTAAGAVGSLAAQIAKLNGAFVVGATGSIEKVHWLLSESIVDDAFNYKTESIPDALAKRLPNGIDAYFDNVGGEQFDANLVHMNAGGRIAVCGMISSYNGQAAPIYNLPLIIYKQIIIKGIFTDEFISIQPKFELEMTGWIRNGEIKTKQHVLKGLSNSIKGLIGLFSGENLGKTIIEIDE